MIEAILGSKHEVQGLKVHGSGQMEVSGVGFQVSVFRFQHGMF